MKSEKETIKMQKYLCIFIALQRFLGLFSVIVLIEYIHANYFSLLLNLNKIDKGTTFFLAVDCHY